MKSISLLRVRTRTQYSLRCVSNSSASSAKASAPIAVVDIHSHFLPHSWPDFAKKYGDSNGPWPSMRHNISDPTRGMDN